MSKEYGYARISTPKQNIDRQVRNILAAHPQAHMIKEVNFRGGRSWINFYGPSNLVIR